MYMNPILPAGGVSWFNHAWIHPAEPASKHIGSGPGVSGLSGMQVKPFVPLRSVRMAPPASIVTIVAPFATLAGAAFIALAISSASLGAFAAFLAGSAPVIAPADKTNRPTRTYVARIHFLLALLKYGPAGRVQCTLPSARRQTRTGRLEVTQQKKTHAETRRRGA